MLNYLSIARNTSIPSTVVPLHCCPSPVQVWISLNMAATFRPVNIETHKEDQRAASPSTPTPTRATFSQSQQRPLPSSPFPQTVQIPESIDEDGVPHREDSQRSKKPRGESEDIGMDDSDGEGNDDGSDDESVNADGTKSNKKKKSQRFYCTDYPPCNLSFTRSEHLARHIRYLDSNHINREFRWQG